MIILLKLIILNLSSLGVAFILNKLIGYEFFDVIGVMIATTFVFTFLELSDRWK
jgi:hypothetical protein